MKKKLVLCLALLTCVFTFASCFSLSVDDNGTVGTTSGTTEHAHVYGEWMNAVSPTCTKEGSRARKCDCGDWDIEKLSAKGHKKNATGRCSDCGEACELWVLDYYVDEFQKPTDKSYIHNSKYISGTFSNSATSNSKLYAQLLFDKEYLTIRLFEYEDRLVTAYSKTEYSITVLDGDGQKHNFSGVMYQGQNRIEIPNKEAFIALLQNNEKISIYLEDDSRYASTYLFDCYRENFKEVYTQLKKSD
jgi:hypothetical protein